MDRIVEQLQSQWDDALVIWNQGGWAMYALLVISVAMFGVGVHVLLKIIGKGHMSVPERLWRTWIDDKSKRRGKIGDLLRYLTSGKTLDEVNTTFEQVRLNETIPFERDLKVMKVCVSAAPLVGLLGTVTGMLDTFGALSSGSSGDQTMGMIAAGISEALVTTETGLVVALPGLFFHHLLARLFESYKAFLTHIESVCKQHLHRKIQKQHRIDRAAQRQIRDMVEKALVARASA